MEGVIRVDLLRVKTAATSHFFLNFLIINIIGIIFFIFYIVIIIIIITGIIIITIIIITIITIIIILPWKGKGKNQEAKQRGKDAIKIRLNR